MSEPCPDAKKEADEIQVAASSKEDTTQESVEATCTENVEKSDRNSPQSKKRKHSPEPVSSKVAKHTEENLNDARSNASNISEKETETDNDNTGIVAKHYNELAERGLSTRHRSRILYMRNFNNWVKSMLISEYLSKVKENKSHGSSVRVLDMCCGKGGDLFKWKNGHVSYVICADIAEVSVDQCKNRYEIMKRKSNHQRDFTSLFNAEFIAADCTKVRLKQRYKDPSIQLDLVSCQFALHYSFESLQQAECMLRNASESLGTGGYFIGTIPNAYILMSRWQKCDGNKFGNDIYNIEFLCDKEKPPLFGAKYNFHLEEVVDCPEFLVHLPTLCKLATKFGLELVKFQRFDEYYEGMKGEGRRLLNTIQALEAYPPHPDTQLLGQADKDYEHADQYIKNSKSRHPRIGTLSQTEWEAISLYAVFVFQKLKTVWNKEGKPEYVKL